MDLYKCLQTRTVTWVFQAISNRFSELVTLHSINYQNAGGDSLYDYGEELQIAVDEVSGWLTRSVFTQHENDEASEILKTLVRSCENVKSSCTNLTETKARTDLVESAKTLLEATLKVVLLWERININKIQDVLQNTSKSLKKLFERTICTDVVTSFRAFVEETLRLAKLLNKVQQELLSQNRRRKIICGIMLLRNGLTTLGAAMHIFMRHPLNNHAKLVRDFAVSLIAKALTDVEEALKHTDIELENEPEEFVLKMDQFFEILSANPGAIFEAPITKLLDSIIIQAECVSQLPISTKDKALLVSIEKVSKHSGAVKELQKKKLNSQEDKSFVSENCNVTFAEILMDDLEELERLVNAAILKSIVSLFWKGREQFDRVLKSFFNSPDKHVQTEDLKKHLENFHTYLQSICVVARFSSNCSTDTSRVEQIKACIQCLKLLDTTIYSIFLSENNSNDVATRRCLEFWYSQWNQCFKQLVSNIDAITDPLAFLKMTCENLRCITENKRSVGGKFVTDDLKMTIEFSFRVVDTSEQFKITYKGGEEDLDTHFDRFEQKLLELKMKLKHAQLSNIEVIIFDLIQDLEGFVKIFQRSKNVTNQFENMLQEKIHQLSQDITNLDWNVTSKTPIKLSTRVVHSTPIHHLNEENKSVQTVNGNCSNTTTLSFGVSELLEQLDWTEATFTKLYDDDDQSIVELNSQNISTQQRLRDIEMTVQSITFLRSLSLRNKSFASHLMKTSKLQEIHPQEPISEQTLESLRSDDSGVAANYHPVKSYSYTMSARPHFSSMRRDAFSVLGGALHKVNDSFAQRSCRQNLCGSVGQIEAVAQLLSEHLSIHGQSIVTDCAREISEALVEIGRYYRREECNSDFSKLTAATQTIVSVCEKIRDSSDYNSWSSVSEYGLRLRILVNLHFADPNDRSVDNLLLANVSQLVKCVQQAVRIDSCARDKQDRNKTIL